MLPTSVPEGCPHRRSAHSLDGTIVCLAVFIAMASATGRFTLDSVYG
jgi:hypothetical protein